MANLTRSIFLGEESHDVNIAEWEGLADLEMDAEPLLDVLRRSGVRLTRLGGDSERRQMGQDFPPAAETMVGQKRLAEVRNCVETVIKDGIEGDLIETGVWRGGVTILMKGIVEAWADLDPYGGSRTVWVADSFDGLPAPNIESYPADAGLDLSEMALLKVDVATVKSNFARYNLLDDRVRFLEGWFSDTLPDAPIDKLAVLRLDGDLYESTMDALVALEPKVSDGGFVIVDDYGSWEACRKAVDEYREANNITAPIEQVDWTGVHWRTQR